ncbi:MAG: DUF6383 domain-containing protein [Tannerellaceae bacterium]|jgi:hypothetical protein|nr:DUF6383 domain-containing protein [Tannerellaceae bacterium]
MNKKFFTLIAGALVLAASFGTANAQVIGTGDATNIKFPDFPKSDGHLYQLYTAYSGTDYVLSLRDGKLGLYETGTTPPAGGQYGETLWCLQFADENEGQNPKVDFTNKAVGLTLRTSVDDAYLPASDSLDVRLGNLGGWGFSPIYKTDIATEKLLYTYFTADSVLVLGVYDNGNPADMKVVAFKERADKAIAAVSGTYTAAPTAFPDVYPLYFTLWKPAELILTANDFNTILGTQEAAAHKLTFVKDKNKTSALNPWSEYNLFATTSNAGGDWLNFAQVKAGTTNVVDSMKFVRVDTSWVNSTGNNMYLAFKFDTIIKNGILSDNDILKQSDFKLTYNVTNDSISIQVAEARFNVAKSVPWDILTSSSAASELIVSLQDLVAKDEIRIVTIGGPEAKTKIQLGLSCADPTGSTLTSLKDGVYIIHNAAGQVLGVPIYTDSLAASGTQLNGVQWITYSKDNVDPRYIPAYQWVVRTIRENNKEYSPIKITNREFPNQLKSSLQLFTDQSSLLFDTKVTTDNFKEVELEIIKDKYLGYYHITKDEARLNTYDLNYLHNLSLEYFLGTSDVDGDSTIIVKKSQTQFKLTPQHNQDTEVDYGYPVTPADTVAIKGLAQLKRTSYVLSVGKKVLHINENQRYTLTTDPSSYNGDSAAFLLKTNNTKNGLHYYALLDTLAVPKHPFPHPITYEKVGISDDNLWAFAQNQKETRTSAFHPEVYTSPLYRRFDGGDYTYGNGQQKVTEPYGAADNAPVWLKFTKQNNLGYQFLFENAPNDANEYRQGITNKQISFLGQYNRMQHPDVNYTFYVDTAYSARPSAGVTGVTAKPQYMLALRPDIVDEDWYVHNTDGYWINSKGDTIRYDTPTSDSVFLPRIVRGFYMFNAEDSVNVRNKDYEGKAAYGAEGDTRLAFVDGAHVADTFYVLPESYKKYNALELQQGHRTLLWTLNPMYKHYLGENTHFEPRFAYNTTTKQYDLLTTTSTSGVLRNGKSMVFQFRLLLNAPNPTRTFLIETRKRTADLQIGPDNGRWIKLQNDVPIVSDEVAFYDISQQSGAELFNVEAGVENGATAIEPAATVSDVKVISEVGAVTVLNAAGKKVSVINLLGQTVASSIPTSDNARIVLPKGIVIVSVDGAPAIKSVVK